MSKLNAFNRFTGKLLMSAAPAALAVMPSQAFAQATNAGTITGINNFGSGATTVSGATSDTAGADVTSVTLGNSKTILDWNGFNLASNDTLNFVLGNNTDIVLNRVNVGAATINGAVRGYMGAVGGTSGGNIWFVAPGGILVGSTGSINAGGILLSTGQISNADFGGGNFSFTGGTGGITTQSGANLRATNGALTLLAPSIQFGGNAVSDNGSIGLVGATDAQLVFDNTLRSYVAITVNKGSSANTAIDATQDASFDAAPVASGGKTYLIAAGNGVGLGSVVLEGTAANKVDFVEGEVILYAAGDVTTTPKSVVANSAVQALNSPSGGGDITIGSANIAAGNLNAVAADDITVNDAVTVSGGSARFEAGDLLSIGKGISVRDTYLVRADDFTGGFAFAPTFTGAAGGNFVIQDTLGGLTVGGLSGSAVLNISTENGDLNVVGPVAASNTVVLGVTNGTSGSLNLGGNVTAPSVTLNSTGSINQSAGIVSATSLNGTAGGSGTLGQANAIGSIGFTAGSGFTLNDVGGLTLGNVNGGAGNVNISSSGAISGQSVFVQSSGGGSTTLTGTSLSFNGVGVVSGTGGVTLNGPLNLVTGSFSTINGTGDATINGTVDGAAGIGFNSTGTTTLNGAVGGATALTDIVTGTAGTTVLKGSVRTTGSQNYKNAVSLQGATTLTSTGSGAISLNTVDGNQALTVNTAGTTTFSGAVGGTTTVGSLVTDGAGSTAVNANIKAASIALNDATTLSADLNAITGTVVVGGPLTVASAGTRNITGTGVGLAAVNSQTAGGSGLSVTATNGLILLNNSIGATAALANLTTSGSTTAMTAGASGVTTTGSQTYNTQIEISGAAGGTKTFTSTAAGDINFNNTIYGILNVVANTAGVTRFASVGGASIPISVTTDAAGSTELSATVRTSGAQTYNDAVNLTGSATASSSSGGNITFAKTVDGNNSLGVDTAGVTRFNGAVGSINPLTGLTTYGGGSTVLAGGSVASAFQNYNDALTLAANTTLSGTTLFLTSIAGGGNDLTLNFSDNNALNLGLVTGVRNFALGGGGATSVSGALITTGSQTYNDALTLTGATTLESTGNGNISLSSVNGANALTINTGGTTNLSGGIGDTNALTSLTTNAGGTTNLAGSVRTTGAQAFGDNVVLTGNTTLAGTTGTFTSVSGSGNDLALNYSGLTTINGASILGVRNLSSGGGGTTTLAGNINTSGTQTYTDAVSLAGNTALTSIGTGANGNITLGSVTGNGFDLTVTNTSGSSLANPTTVALNGAIAGVNLLDIDSGVIDINAALTASTISLTSVHGGIDMGANVAGGSAITLDARGAISGSGTVAAGTVALVGDGGVGTTLAPLHTAATNLTANSSSGSVFIDEANGVTLQTAGALTNSAAGSYSVNAAGPITVNASIAGTNGVTLAATSGDLSFATGVGANANFGDLRLTSSGTISGGGPLVAQNILLTAGDWTNGILSAATLQEAQNVLITDTLGGLAISPLTGLSAANGLTIQTTNGGALDVGGISAPGFITLVSASDLALTGNINGGAGLLMLIAGGPSSSAGGAISQSGGVITAGLLGGSAGLGSSVALSQNNAVTSLGNITATGLSFVNGGALNVIGMVDGRTGTTTLRSNGGNLTLAGTSSVLGNEVVLSANRFINNSGAEAVTAATRWMIYSVDPNANTYGGLNSNNTAIWGATYGSFDPTTVSGNRYLFVPRPTLTLTTVDASKVYGTDLTGSSSLYSVSGLQSGIAGAFIADTAATAFSGSPHITSDGFAANADVAAGPYAITASQGTMASTAGYAFNFVNNGKITVSPKTLTGTVTANDKTYDGTTGATGSVSLSGVIAGDQVTASALLAFADKNAGNGKTVTITGGSLSGGDAGNYTLSLPASTLANIFQRALTGTVTANDKTYDGTTGATGSVSLSGVIAGDQVTASALLAFADKNAGNGKTVTITGGSLSGGDAGNYTLSLPASTLANIFQRALTGTVTANDKTYDGTTGATGSVSLSGVIAGDQVTASALLAFADKNAGNGKTVTITGGSLSGGDAGNYTLSLPASTLANIFQRALTGTVTANDKTYDGTTGATGSVSLSGVIAGDQVTASALLAFADKNAGNGKTVTITGGSLSGGDAGNYTLSLPASTLANIFQRALTGTVTANDKTYDGTTGATGSVSLSGVIAGDQVTASALLAFADKNAGNGKTVTITGGSLSGGDAGNYTLSLPASTLANIFQRALTGTVTANDKTYDGTTGATGSVSLSGVIAGDQVTASALLAFADKNAGNGKTVTITGGSLSGGDAGNYTLSLPASTLANIFQRALTGTVTANDKTYDGTTGATGSVSLSGVIAGDQVTASALLAFADKNAGNGKTVTITGGSLSGGDAGNYTLSLPASTLANIFQRALTGTVTANDKTYDGTTGATGSVSLSGVIAGDQVTASALLAFADKNAGNGKTVTITGGSLSGGDAGNYTLSLPASTLANIFQRALTGTVTANDKTYDGTTGATGSVSLSGVIAGDQVTASALLAFADKNAGNGKTVTITGGSLSGGDAGNYTLSLPASTLANIFQRALTGTVTANDKTYDGTTGATGSVSLSGVIAGDQVTASALLAFADKNAGNGKTVTITGGSLSGGDAGNYTLSLPASTLANIFQRALTVTADSVSKPQGSADPALTYEITSGQLVGGDLLLGTLTRSPGESAGDYTILQGTLSSTPNYELTYVPGILSIEPSVVIPHSLRVPNDIRGLIRWHSGPNSREVPPLVVLDARDCEVSGRKSGCGTVR